MQLLAAANPPPPTAPLVPDVERSRHSNRSGNRSGNISADQVGRGRRQAPSSSLREKSSSESSKTPTRSGRGRSPRRGDHIRARDKSTSQKIRDLDARLDAINTGAGAPVTVDTLIKQTEPPFTERILRAQISSKFKLPTQLGIYEGKTDPMDHLDSYKSLMSVQGCSDEVMCKAFSATLKGPARSWFRKLSPGTIDYFGDLSRLFVANFMSCRNRQKNASHLFTIHQKETENLKDFVKRFNQAILEVEDPSDKVIIMAMMEGLRPGPLRPRTPPRRPEFILPPLKAPVAQVLSEIKHEEFVKWPGKIKTDPQKRNRNKYCEFHRDHGHNTEDCFQLKEQIADLIKRGYLRKYITDCPLPNSPERRYGDNRPTAENIQTIHGGFGSGGCSTSSRKRHARSAFRSVEEEVYNLSSPCVGDQPPITFSNDDLRGVHLPHDDALVVSAVIANFNVQRILIDNGSSADILFISAFARIKIGLDKLHPFHTPPDRIWRKYDAPLGMDQPTYNPGRRASPDHRMAGFYCGGLPLALQCHPRATNFRRNQGDHLDLSPEAKVSHPNRDWRDKGRSESGQAMLHLGHEGRNLINPKETNNTKPLEEIIPISIHPDYPDRHIMIDVPGIDPEIAMHKLFTDPKHSPVRQKRRKFAPERLKVIEDKVNKLIRANVVREAHYPDWLANVVVAPKKGEKWRNGSYIVTKVMPFGLKNAGATYQRLVNKMFKEQIGKTMEVYIDDMLVKSLRSSDHIAHLEEAFSILRRHRMMLNPSKCIFGVSSVRKFLGFLVTKRGIEVNPDQIQALITMSSPRSIREVQQLTGRVAAFNRFVSKSADKCLPFFKILRKSQGFQWNEESKNAFQQLKEYLGSPPLLTVPATGEDLYVYLSISPTAVSAVLIREEDQVQRPVYYVSKVLLGAETRYPRIEKLAYALMIAARKLHHYFQAHPIIVLTDQPLKHILQRPDASGRLLKWSVELSEFHIEYRPRTTIKAQVLADFFVESTHEDTPQPETAPPEARILKEQTSEKDLAHWILFVDGSSNQHGCGAGLVIRAPSGEQMEYAIRMGFKATNNEAEYEALLAGLRVATELGAQSLEVFSDSQLVVNQVQGDYLAKDARMIAYFRCIPLEFLDNPSIGATDKILQTEENPTWMDEIIAYLRNGILPEDKLQARRLQYRSASFCIFKGKLYKRSFSGPLLRCLRPEEAEYVLRENTRRHMRKSLRSKRYAPVSRLPHTEMVPMSSPWPFAQWGIDILGPLPRAPLQKKFLIVAIDYFTKWIEAQPLTKITEKNTRDFVWKHLVCRFGVPKVIISDNARQFDNDRFRLFCSDLAISHHFSSPGHPQANGQVEITNRTILRNLKARLDRSKGEWAENLPSILWAYHTTSRIPTGETPYSMVFGTESVIPVEIGMPSFRVLNFDKEINEAELRVNLDLLEEKRENAELRQMAYKCQVARYYNQRVKHRSFLPGDLVLRKVTLSTKEPNVGKLGPTWEGPYKVIKVSRPGTYWLEDPDGKALSHPWNAEHLKKYYQ
ncbi:hypothetical protein Acr_00g0059990 [Actinidia rufa]|uniref:Integrase catalytic domain-containing protein n=1 Tax=Actinidia rufa TaxID=165716 RepID=A0A7J0DN86_9ERIC|nr:hypothetical protein Acr_00g0059990 [Actinidia rufa]